MWLVEGRVGDVGGEKLRSYRSGDDAHEAKTRACQERERAMLSAGWGGLKRERETVNEMLSKSQLWTRQVPWLTSDRHVSVFGPSHKFGTCWESNGKVKPTCSCRDLGTSKFINKSCRNIYVLRTQTSSGG